MLSADARETRDDAPQHTHRRVVRLATAEDQAVRPRARARPEEEAGAGARAQRPCAERRGEAQPRTGWWPAGGEATEVSDERCDAGVGAARAGRSGVDGTRSGGFPLVGRRAREGARGLLGCSKKLSTNRRRAQNRVCNPHLVFQFIMELGTGYGIVWTSAALHRNSQHVRTGKYQKRRIKACEVIIALCFLAHVNLLPQSAPLCGQGGFCAPCPMPQFRTRRVRRRWGRRRPCALAKQAALFVATFVLSYGFLSNMKVSVHVHMPCAML